MNEGGSLSPSSRGPESFLGRPWERLGSVLGASWSVWGSSLGRVGAVLVAFKVVLDVKMKRLGSVLERPGRLLGRLGGLQGRLGRQDEL